MDRPKPKPSDGPGSSIQAVEQGMDSVSKSSTPSVDGPSHDVFLPSDQIAESLAQTPPTENPPFSFAHRTRLGGPGTSVPADDVTAIASGDQHILAGGAAGKREAGSVPGGGEKRQRLSEAIPQGGERAVATPAGSEVSIGESPLVGGDRQEASKRHAKKIIIDTDPGIDDAFAILLALQSPELEVLALTTIFGNVRTPLATTNALHLLELARRPDIPVIQGEVKSLKGVAKERIASFVHGEDGLGNTWPKPPLGKALTGSAAQYLVDAVKKNPREITIVALGPLTNLAQAVLLDPKFATNVGEIVILGGAFLSNGNVNPSAEANILGDPEAADLVFGCGAPIKVIGLDVTRHILMTDKQLIELRESRGPFGKYLHDASLFYLKYHQEAYKNDVIMLHDPSVMMAVIDPSLFTFREGPVRVEVAEGPFRALTIAYFGNKKWAAATEWCSRPSVEVAVACKTKQVVQEIMDRLSRPSAGEV